MTDTEPWRGPVLVAIDPDDAEALALLQAEQRARLQTVRAHAIWDWLGGVPGWETSPAAMYGTIGFLALVPITIVVAGFTRGPVLWTFAALAALAILPQLFVFLPRQRRVVARHRRARQELAAVVVAEPEAADPRNVMLRSVLALVRIGDATPAALRDRRRRSRCRPNSRAGCATPGS